MSALLALEFSVPVTLFDYLLLLVFLSGFICGLNSHSFVSVSLCAEYVYLIRDIVDNLENEYNVGRFELLFIYANRTVILVSCFPK